MFMECLTCDSVKNMNAVCSIGWPVTVWGPLATERDRASCCWECCCRPVASPKECCIKAVRETNPRGCSRDTSWVWARALTQPAPDLAHAFWERQFMLRTMVWLDRPPEAVLLASLQAPLLELELPGEELAARKSEV